MPPSPQTTAEPSWVDGPDGYTLGLVGTVLACRNPKGRRLKSVPKRIRESAQAQRLLHLAERLARHERECRDRVEYWMLGALAVPAALIAEIWPDPAWRGPLENLYVAPAGGGDGGFLRGVGDDGRIGVVDLDAETAWWDAERVVITHPALIGDLADVREFAQELGVVQGVVQLTREVHTKPGDLDTDATRHTAYAEGEFEQLRHAVARAQGAGFTVRGGYAVCRAVDDGRPVQARYWIGADDPSWESYTGALVWVGADDRVIPLAQVGPVAWSEGVRMAEAIYAGRKTDTEEA